jgi:DNA-binding response OmpR family regulator
VAFIICQILFRIPKLVGLQIVYMLIKRVRNHIRRSSKSQRQARQKFKFKHEKICERFSTVIYRRTTVLHRANMQGSKTVIESMFWGVHFQKRNTLKQKHIRTLTHKHTDSKFSIDVWNLIYLSVICILCSYNFRL